MLTPPKLHVIERPQDIAALIDRVNASEYVAFDTETTGVHHGAEVIGVAICCGPDEAYYIITAYWDSQTNKLVYIDHGTPLQTLLLALTTKSLIMHNAVFDCQIVENYYKISLIKALHTDTMVLAHLLNENRRIGLKELAKEYFGQGADKEQAEMKASVIANGGKWTAKDKEMYKCDKQIMATYGAKDAWLTYMLFIELVPELYEQGLDKFFYEDESMPLLKGPTYQLNTIGLKTDLTKLAALKKTLEAECLEAKAFILTETFAKVKDRYPGTNKTNHFNIGSSQQLSWLLFGVLGLEFNTLTPVGKTVSKHLLGKLPYAPGDKKAFIAFCEQRKGEIYQPEATVNGKKVKAKTVKDPWSYIKCDKKTLQKFAPKLKWVERLLEYQRKTKILTTYVIGIEKRVQYGIIRPSFLQTGTTSGRYASRNPNFQNLPRDDKRVKACITARPGKVLVGADQSQLEPRVFAYFSKDEGLINAFKGTEDFYSVIGMRVFNKTDCTPHKEGSPEAFGVKYKKLRDLAKVIALAVTYGATAHQLAPTIGKSIEETEQIIADYLEEFPKVAQMMLNSHATAKETGQVLNLFGRPRRMPEATRIEKLYGKVPHDELPYEARNILNLAVNHVIQSTGASIMNRAAIKFYNDIKELGIDAPIVCQVHDSLIAECRIEDAETVSLIMQNALETAVDLKTIELEAIPKAGNNLAEV
jgi:DNA polymerase I-like protein with 3'-5' exonuclease and polymerase domains